MGMPKFASPATDYVEKRLSLDEIQEFGVVMGAANDKRSNEFDDRPLMYFYVEIFPNRSENSANQLYPAIDSGV